MTFKLYQMALFEAALGLLLGYIVWQTLTRLRLGEPWIGRVAGPQPRQAPRKDKASSTKARTAKAKEAEQPVEIQPIAEDKPEPIAHPAVSVDVVTDELSAMPPKRRRSLLKVSELALVDAAIADNGLESGDEALTSPAAETDSSLYRAVEARLERVFNMFEAGTISLDGFERIVQAEQDAARMRREAILQSTSHAHEAGFQDRCADAEQALIAIKWCLDWAQDMRRKAA